MVARSDGSVRSLVPNSITADEGVALRDRVEREDATIETGLGYGIPALFVCEGLLGNGHPETRHTAVDPYRSTRCSSAGLQVLDEAGLLELLDFHEEVRGAGVIVVDDLQLPAVERATRFCTSNLGWTQEDGSPADGLHQWAVFRTPEVTPERSFDFYVDF